MKKKIIFVVIVFLLFCVWGCTMEKKNMLSSVTISSSEENVELNKRQKSILEAEGLPTDYEKLTWTQKRAIVSIEEMLQYVDEKYNKTFLYAGYVPAGPMETEHLIAYPSDGDKQDESFTITRTENGYEDDYISVVINDDFFDYVSNGIQPLLTASEQMKIFGKTATLLERIPEDASSFDGNVESSMLIFLDGKTFDAQNIEEFKSSVIDFLNEHRLYSTVQIIILVEGNLQYLTKYNYTEYLSKNYYTYRNEFYIKK